MNLADFIIHINEQADLMCLDCGKRQLPPELRMPVPDTNTQGARDGLWRYTPAEGMHLSAVSIDGQGLARMDLELEQVGAQEEEHTPAAQMLDAFMCAGALSPKYRIDTVTLRPSPGAGGIAVWVGFTAAPVPVGVNV